MDNSIQDALQIISDYRDISIVSHDEISIVIQIIDTQYCLWAFDCKNNAKMPFITVVNNNEKFPHFMQKEVELQGVKHRSVCLYESGLMVFSLFSFKEKIEFIINQLLGLLNLSPARIEKEYQKEFLYYWNSLADNHYKIDLFIESSDSFKWLDVYYQNESKNKRIIHSYTKVNDKDKYKHKEKTSALYIPIIDVQGIIPPISEKMWTSDDVMDILDNRQIARISYDTYCEIINNSYSQKTIILVFELSRNGITFCCELVFKNPGTAKLINKIAHEVVAINPLYTRRCDFSYLNAQIGNDLGLVGKRIAIVGVGSLGSYIAKEIVKIGIKDITLIDDDLMNYENIMRHQLQFVSTGLPKVIAMKIELEWIHPEINVEPIYKKVSAKNFEEFNFELFDLVIFAVGSSDVQLECNQKFKQIIYSKPVLFSWLEGNGINSHVMGIDYSRPGCYQCLFTDSNGNIINNKVNETLDIESEHNLLRNGCGGTRIAYGNGILLQTTDIALMAIKKIFSNDFENNFLIDCIRGQLIDKNNEFYERNCHLCDEV